MNAYVVLALERFVASPPTSAIEALHSRDDLELEPLVLPAILSLRIPPVLEVSATARLHELALSWPKALSAIAVDCDPWLRRDTSALRAGLLAAGAPEDAAEEAGVPASPAGVVLLEHLRNCEPAEETAYLSRIAASLKELPADTPVTARLVVAATAARLETRPVELTQPFSPRDLSRHALDAAGLLARAAPRAVARYPNAFALLVHAHHPPTVETEFIWPESAAPRITDAAEHAIAAAAWLHSALVDHHRLVAAAQGAALPEFPIFDLLASWVAAAAAVAAETISTPSPVMATRRLEAVVIADLAARGWVGYPYAAHFPAPDRVWLLDRGSRLALLAVVSGYPPDSLFDALAREAGAVTRPSATKPPPLTGVLETDETGIQRTHFRTPLGRRTIDGAPTPADIAQSRAIARS